MTPTHTPTPLTPEQLQALSQEVRQALTALYGDRLDRVILYGSYARGDFHAESDVDYLVVLRDEAVKAGREVRFMAQAIGKLALRYSTELSVLPVSTRRYQAAETPFFGEARMEGQLV
ncbi:nucleotidyltransferase domain-containing protein [Spirosoma luteolum]